MKSSLEVDFVRVFFRFHICLLFDEIAVAINPVAIGFYDYMSNQLMCTVYRIDSLFSLMFPLRIALKLRFT